MGSRGFGASKLSRKARLGSVSDYCVHHCDCPVVVVRYPEDKDGEEAAEVDPSSPIEVPKVKLRSASGKILSGSLQGSPEPVAVEFSTDSPKGSSEPVAHFSTDSPLSTDSPKKAVQG